MSSKGRTLLFPNKETVDIQSWEKGANLYKTVSFLR